MNAISRINAVKDTDDAKASNTKDTLPNPADVRAGADLGIAEMAELMGMSKFGYEQWESGARRAGGPAYRLLHLIARDGKPVIDALREVRD